MDEKKVLLEILVDLDLQLDDLEKRIFYNLIRLKELGVKDSEFEEAGLENLVYNFPCN
jgi:hypothetical protein